jgi:hypothetical protein
VSEVIEQSGIDRAGIFCPAVVARDLSKGASETFRGLLQLALESVDLLRDILKLSLSKHSSFGDLVGGAIGSAHCAPDSLRDTGESALPGHVYPPVETDAILHHKQGCANLLPKKHGSRPASTNSRTKAPATFPDKAGAGRGCYIGGEFQLAEAYS